MHKEQQIFQVLEYHKKDSDGNEKPGKIGHNSTGSGLDNLVQEYAFCSIGTREPLRIFKQVTPLYDQTNGSGREM